MFFSEGKAVKMPFRGVVGGENLKILKIFIFCYFDFVDRLYINTYGPDLFIARRPGRRVRSTHFILSPKVDVILLRFPLTVYRIK